MINFAVAIIVSQFTPKPSVAMQELVEEIRYPGKSRLVAAHAEGHLEEVAAEEGLVDEPPPDRGEPPSDRPGRH
jgi:cation/acetate symporter